VYTRRGDKGETSLFGPRRVSKDSPRVEAYGSIDELNSCIGFAISFSKVKGTSEQLKKVQRLLFVAGADLATEFAAPGEGEKIPRIRKDDTKWLEEANDDLSKKLPTLENFILPGGGRTSAVIQIARSICRRAERRIVTAGKVDEINPELIPFFNRLSTYLFNLARYSNFVEGKKEEVWRKEG
jgi:cob(I)alamin adenosyltransferase